MEVLGPVLDEWATQPQLATATLGSLGKEAAGVEGCRYVLLLLRFGTLSLKLSDHDALRELLPTGC